MLMRKKVEMQFGSEGVDHPIFKSLSTNKRTIVFKYFFLIENRKVTTNFGLFYNSHHTHQYTIFDMLICKKRSF